MSKLWESILNIFNFIGDNSGCHQIPERSFTIKGYTLPICARCTGVVIGQLITMIFLFFKIILPLWIALVFALIMLIEKCGALCSFYAERGGLIIGFEG